MLMHRLSSPVSSPRHTLPNSLSITKWIHIHDSDIGLLRFFKSITDVLRPNGVLFLEPQPDPSYEQARRELPAELRTRARRLRLRMQDFAFVLETILGMDKVELRNDAGTGEYQM